MVKTEATGLSREYAAEIRARIESRLSFRVPGKLLERKVNLGDEVKAGQLLARLDAQDLLLAQAAAGPGDHRNFAGQIKEIVNYGHRTTFPRPGS